jgi:hypothetical protein
MKTTIIALILASLVQSAYAQSSTRNQKEFSLHIKNAALITAIPANKMHTNNDWGVLNTLYPNSKWAQVENKRFPETRKINLAKDISISAAGVRTMIVASIFEHTTIESGQDLFTLLRVIGVVSEQLCDSQEQVSFRERYFVISIPGHRPLRGIYEFSSGSAFTSQSITFSNEITIPKIGSPAGSGVWTSKC